METVGLVMEVGMPGHPVRQKSQTQDELVRRIMDGAALIPNNLQIMRKEICAVLKQARSCIANAGGYLEQ
jgi:hypothetical protein